MTLRRTAEPDTCTEVLWTSLPAGDTLARQDSWGGQASYILIFWFWLVVNKPTVMLSHIVVVPQVVGLCPGLESAQWNAKSNGETPYSVLKGDPLHTVHT